MIRRGEPLRIVNFENIERSHPIKHIDMDISQLEKGGYPHFMLKEIYEQPQTLIDCIRGRINPEGTDVVLSGVMDNKERFLNARRIIIVACGTSWHAALIGEHLIEELCRIPVEVEYASEFRYRNPVIYPDDVVIAISQSGETADTLAAVEIAKNREPSSTESATSSDRPSLVLRTADHTSTWVRRSVWHRPKRSPDR